MHFGWLIGFLFFLSIFVYFAHDADNADGWFGFLVNTKSDKINKFFIEHEFYFVMVAFWGTAFTVIGAIYFLFKFIASFF